VTLPEIRRRRDRPESRGGSILGTAQAMGQAADRSTPRAGHRRLRSERKEPLLRAPSGPDFGSAAKAGSREPRGRRTLLRRPAHARRGPSPGEKNTEYKGADLSDALTPQGEPFPSRRSAFSDTEKPTEQGDRLIWFNDGTALPQVYYNHIVQRFPGATWSRGISNGTPSLFVHAGGRIVGVCAPEAVDAPHNASDARQRARRCVMARGK